jgi:hypothetical protein
MNKTALAAVRTISSKKGVLSGMGGTEIGDYTRLQRLVFIDFARQSGNTPTGEKNHVDPSHP